MKSSPQKQPCVQTEPSRDATPLETQKREFWNGIVSKMFLPYATMLQRYNSAYGPYKLHQAMGWENIEAKPFWNAILSEILHPLRDPIDFISCGMGKH